MSPPTYLIAEIVTVLLLIAHIPQWRDTSAVVAHKILVTVTFERLWSFVAAIAAVVHAVFHHRLRDTHVIALPTATVKSAEFGTVFRGTCRVLEYFN